MASTNRLGVAAHRPMAGTNRLGVAAHRPMAGTNRLGVATRHGAMCLGLMKGAMPERVFYRRDGGVTARSVSCFFMCSDRARNPFLAILQVHSKRLESLRRGSGAGVSGPMLPERAGLFAQVHYGRLFPLRSFSCIIKEAPLSALDPET
jgi:hypothetical protein